MDLLNGDMVNEIRHHLDDLSLYYTLFVCKGWKSFVEKSSIDRLRLFFKKETCLYKKEDGDKRKNKCDIQLSHYTIQEIEITVKISSGLNHYLLTLFKHRRYLDRDYGSKKYSRTLDCSCPDSESRLTKCKHQHHLIDFINQRVPIEERISLYWDFFNLVKKNNEKMSITRGKRKSSSWDRFLTHREETLVDRHVFIGLSDLTHLSVFYEIFFNTNK